MNEFIFIFVALVLPVPTPDVNEMKENTLVVYDRVSDLFVVEYRNIIFKKTLSKANKNVKFLLKTK